MEMMSRTNSICPTPEELLFDYIKTNNTKNLISLINKEGVKLLSSTNYSNYIGQQILSIACTLETTTKETIKILIDNEANVNYKNDEALFKAIFNKNSDCLEALLTSNKCNLKSLDNGNTALLLLIKNLGEIDGVDYNNFVKHVELLIKFAIDVNRLDGKNKTAIYWAAKKGYKAIVAKIIELVKENIILDENTEKLIKEKNLYDLTTLKNTEQTPEDLFTLLKSGNEEKFIEIFNRSNPDPNSDDGCMTFLQYATDRNLLKTINFLIDKNDIKIDKTTQSNKQTPLDIAINHQYYEIITLLLNKCHISIQSLCEAIKSSNEELIKIIIDSNQIKNKNVDINDKDNLGQTPLHYSVKYANSNVTLHLLENGACLGTQNRLNFMPIEFIQPELLEKHLNDCIIEQKTENNEFPAITLKLDTLIPNRSVKEEVEFDHEPLLINKNRGNNGIDEMRIIGYMVKTPEFRHLLKHPLIVSYLTMKWHKIRCLFYVNFVFYLLFAMSMLTFIFTKYANFDENPSKTIQNISLISLIMLILTYILLIIRELFQVIVSPKLYLNNFDNYIEVLLLTVTTVIIFDNAANNDIRRQVSATAVILLAFELVLMLGQHPKFCTLVLMFKTVSVNFFKLFIWYSMLIVAFALSFNILFTKPVNETTNKGNLTTNNDDGNKCDDVFTGPGPSLFKTIVMLTGEFDAGSIDFNMFPVVSRLIFIIFVFMITIILLNLLNGLAVSDTQSIKSDAELVGHISRAKHIEYVESMFVGNVLKDNIVINYLRNAICCFPKCNIVKTSNKYNLFAHKINNGKQILITEDNRLRLPVLQKNNSRDDVECQVCYRYFDLIIDKETRNRITNIIRERREGKTEMEQLKADHKLLTEKLDNILKILQTNKI